MAGPFELYLIRHGVAEDRGDAWPDDNKRPLTENGIARMRKSARGLADLGVEIDIVLSSPLVRARQTAEIVVAALNPKPALVNVDSLAPDGSFTAIVADLEKHGRKPRLALVGHEPSIGELAARLIGSRHALEFKKGGICRIDLDELPPAGPGDLRWMMTPKILRALRD
jgi:phosphohistidine phosphatase